MKRSRDVEDAATESRIRVVGLPRDIDQKRLKAAFGSCGEVTDCAVIRNPQNNRPRMAFLGFKVASSASAAVKTMNNSFLGTSKLTVEFAHRIGDASTEEKAWSRHTKRKLEERKRIEKVKQEQEEEVRRRAEEAATQAEKAERKKKESRKERDVQNFLEAAQGSQKRMIWENDMEVGVGAQPDATDAESLESASDAESIHSLNSEEEVARQAQLTAMSDADFFKSKQSTSAAAVPSTKKQDGESPSGAKGPKKKVQRECTVEVDLMNTPQLSPQENRERNLAEIAETGRLYMRNLPYTATEEEVRELCNSYGVVAESHIPLTRDSKQSKGVAFIQYAIPENAVAAYEALNNSIFQGRVVVVEAGKPNPYEQDDVAVASGAGSSYKKTKLMKEKAEQANPNRWNTLFMHGDTVASALSKRLEVDKTSLVNLDTKDVAARLAIGEAHFTTEVREMFSEEGLDVSVLTDESRVKKRSDRIILVKNLPKDTQIPDLRALFEGFGAIEKVVAPREATIALISFVTAQEAKVAFRKLAFRPFNKVPLFLEWAPVGALKEKTITTTAHAMPATVDRANETDDIFEDDQRTLYVTNIAFSIKSEDFDRFIRITVAGEAPSVQSIKLSMKGGQSKGYGFVEFKSHAAASRAAKLLQGAVLMQRPIDVQFSAAPQKSDRTDSECPEGYNPLKLTVKNVPFETTKQDILKLFSAFSQVKSVRLPRKAVGAAGGGGAKRPHRGFAFVEFATPQEAAAARKKLSNTHAYGRHLVIEYAKADDTVGSSSLKERD